MKRTIRSPFTVHRSLAAAVAAVWLAACGVETATTAATGAVIKKQEADAGRKTMEGARRKVEQAAREMQQRADQGAAAADK